MSVAGTLAVAAKATGSSSAHPQSDSSTRPPASPASRAAQLSRAVPPSGEVAPMPVMTIFLVMRELSPWLDRAGRTEKSGGADQALSTPPCGWVALVFNYVVDSVADGFEIFYSLIGDFHVKLVFDVHDDGHHRDRVNIEVIRE